MDHFYHKIFNFNWMYLICQFIYHDITKLPASHAWVLGRDIYRRFIVIYSPSLWHNEMSCTYYWRALTWAHGAVCDVYSASSKARNVNYYRHYYIEFPGIMLYMYVLSKSFEPPLIQNHVFDGPKSKVSMFTWGQCMHIDMYAYQSYWRSMKLTALEVVEVWFD